jgi:hypothetical protein
LTAATETACPGRGLVLPARPDAPKHPYVGASAECWAFYGEVLAREYEDPAYSRVHQLTVDTYSVQHPGVPERRSIQSLALHLITLCLVLEHGVDPTAGPGIHKRLVKRPGFDWLEPPVSIGEMTVADVRRARSATMHGCLVRRWALDVWHAWTPHHATVRRWIHEARLAAP